ncbi:MAG: hypothetical protein HY953_08670 [Candidatus Rokubacteria bacterium]|nr:hypothetical protein [Candidatus Rokubacteria bacterium]
MYLALQADLEPLRGEIPTGFHILSFGDAERFVTVEVFTENGYENDLVTRRCAVPERGRSRPGYNGGR